MKRGSPEHMECLARANPTYHRLPNGLILSDHCRQLGVDPKLAYNAIQDGVPPHEAAEFVMEKKLKRMIKKCQQPTY